MKKIVRNCENLWKLTKIVKNDENWKNNENWSKLSKMIKIDNNHDKL